VSEFGELGRGLRLVNWFLNPFQRPTVPSVYDLIGTDSPTASGLYLNLGYWREAVDLDQACEALVELVGRRAQLGDSGLLVDCGFGFADQDLYWARRHPDLAVVGLNITASHVDVARERVAAAGLADRIDLRLASATEMPLADASADAVIALESAFHFRTRERFFREALRVLKPGGRIVTADILPILENSGRRQDARLSRVWRWTASRFSIPSENTYPRKDYRALLQRLGFVDVEVESIREQVYAPLYRHLKENPAVLRRLHPVAGLLARVSLLPRAERVFRGLDYVIGFGRKPTPA
jgi:ubiquinone/menaquinone biosynthesis C-methylase UbiE